MANTVCLIAESSFISVSRELFWRADLGFTEKWIVEMRYAKSGGGFDNCSQ